MIDVSLVTYCTTGNAPEWLHDNSFIKTSTSILRQACVMDLQTAIQIDAVSNQGCKVSLQDNIGYHLEDTDIHLLVTYLLYSLVCQTVCLGESL